VTGSRAIKLITAAVVFVIVGVGIYLRNTRGEEQELADLPEGVIAQACELTVSDLDAYLASLPEKQRETKSKDLEGALEELIEKRLLMAEARKLPEEVVPDTEGMDRQESQEVLLKALREHVVKDVKVPEKDIRAYYEEHKYEYEGQPGGSYEEMHGSIADYLRYDLKYEAFDKYKESLVAKADVKMDREWILEVRARVRDPLAEARASGKVVIADFGRGI